jgi:hypothetical protein
MDYWTVIAGVIGLVVGAVVAWKYKQLSKEQVLAIIDDAIKADQDLLNSGLLTPDQVLAVKGKIVGLQILKEAIEQGAFTKELEGKVKALLRIS